MIWKLKPKPNAGDKRIITKFLLFPIELDNEIRWLGKYSYEEECYCSRITGNVYWFKTKWID